MVRSTAVQPGAALLVAFLNEFARVSGHLNEVCPNERDTLYLKGKCKTKIKRETFLAFTTGQGAKGQAKEGGEVGKDVERNGREGTVEVNTTLDQESTRQTVFVQQYVTSANCSIQYIVRLLSTLTKYLQSSRSLIQHA